MRSERDRAEVRGSVALSCCNIKWIKKQHGYEEKKNFTEKSQDWEDKGKINGFQDVEIEIWLRKKEENKW